MKRVLGVTTLWREMMSRHHEGSWEGVYGRVQVRMPDVNAKKIPIILWTADAFALAQVVLVAR
jgi:hypothetical protein